MNSADAAGAVAAAIDIGSNSIKMTIGRDDGAGGIEQIDWASEVVRLGEGLERTGRLDSQRVDTAVATVRQFVERAKGQNAGAILAVATEATRAAANGQAFLDRVRRETGVDVWLIDGREEAALTFRGLQATTDLSGRVVVADIGGGSTELITAHDGVVLHSRSLQLGSGRLTERHIRADPPQGEELAAVNGEASAEVGRGAVSLRLPAGEDVRLIVVGGTGEFMARLVPDERQITRAAVGLVLAKLQVLTAAELADEIDVPEARARVLPAGVAIVAAIAERVQTDRIEVARSGLRVGLLLEAVAMAADDERNEPVGSGSRRTVEGQADPRAIAAAPDIDEPGFRDLLNGLIAERWQAVWDTVPAAIAGEESEAVHDVRVASRRLRAALDVAAPIYPQRWFKRLRRAAKSITASLGAVRDRDVLLDALRADRDAAALAERPGIHRLIVRIEGERFVARAAMERYLRELQEGTLRSEVERRFPLPRDAQRTQTTKPDDPQ